MNKRHENIIRPLRKQMRKYLKSEPDNLFPRNSTKQGAVSCHKYFVTRGCSAVNSGRLEELISMKGLNCKVALFF